jgi:hypothetical protein
MEPKKPKENIIRRRGENSRVALLIVIGVCILASSLWFNQRDERINASNQFGGQGNGFAGRGIEDPYRAPRKGEFLSATLPYQKLVHIPLSVKKVRIHFLYRVHNLDALWFSVPVNEDGFEIHTLVHHSQLLSLSWPHISDGSVSLFQKKIVYKQVEDFIFERAYELGTTVTEPLLVQLWAPLIPFVRFVDESLVIYEDSEYLLTTWLKPRIFPDNWFEFSRIIDISEAERNEDGSVAIMLTGSGGAEMIEMTKPQVEYGRE